MNTKKIGEGIYLVVDPSMNKEMLLQKLRQLVQEAIAAVQIWDHFLPGENITGLVNEILDLCHPNNIPVLINNRRDLLDHTNLDGVHFDSRQDAVLEWRNELNRDCIVGITCGNDLSTALWADANGLDYISFCSVFPSSTAGDSCELVSFDTIREALKITSLPVFLAGGIKPGNINRLNELGYTGIAVISGIMNADKPVEALKMYQEKINRTVNENRNH